MTIYNVVMTLGVVVVLAIIAKGFWSAGRVKAIEQPDNSQQTPPDGSHHGGD